MKTMLRLLALEALVVLLSIIFPLVLFAGTTGKIAGFVRDKDTKEPLPGVNVVIEGTTLGAATNMEGYYFIINVPPGTYKVTASMVGYVKLTVENVRVAVDLTAKVDFALEPTVVEIGKTITITAERPLVEPDVTTKRFTVTAEQIRDMPVTDVRQIMTLQSGIIQMIGYQNKIAAFEDRGLDQVHVRGGRNGEIAYMIDGMYVEDAIYAGMGTFINREAIEELSVIVGNFDAEYGQAQASVVNIVTKEGSKDYRGLLEFSSGDVPAWLGSTPDDLRDYHDAIGSFSGPLPGFNNANFFFSGEQSFSRYAVYEFDDITYDTTCVERDRSGRCIRRAGDERRDFVYGAWRKPYVAYWPPDAGPLAGKLAAWDKWAGWHAFGFDQKWDGLAKLNFNFTPTMKLALTYRKADRRFRSYIFSMQYAENGNHVVKDQTEQLGVIWKHQVSPSTFYEFRANHFWKHRTYRVHGIDDKELARDEYPADQSGSGGFGFPLTFVRYDTIWAQDASGQRRIQRIKPIYRGDTNQFWTRNFQDTYEFSLDLTSQVNPHHQIKTGIEYKTYGIPPVFGLKEREGMVFNELQFPWASTPSIDKYEERPEEAAFFVQDKMEFENLIVNAGVRIDYANSGGGTWTDPTRPSSGFTIGKKKYQVSPRLGLGHPITDKATLHFSYGHFFQIPEYRNLYRGTTRDPNEQNERLITGAVGIYGNPHLEAQKTVAYEIGVRQQLGEVWAIDLTAWYKENSGEAGSINVIGFDPTYFGLYNYYIFTNYDYGSAKGFDISIEKRFSNYYSGILNYTYSVAKANRYYSWTGYWNSQTAETEPKKEFLMDYDQPHVLSFNGVVSFPKDFGPRLWRFKPLEEFTLNLIFRANAGYPYTPPYSLEPNTARRPWTMQFDAIIRKDFTLYKHFKAGLFARIYNVLDRKNPISVYAETGSPTDPGPTASPTQTSTYYDRPYHFGPRRSIDVGIKVLF